jgi:hypothetical protein
MGGFLQMNYSFGVESKSVFRAFVLTLVAFLISSCASNLSAARLPVPGEISRIAIRYAEEKFKSAAYKDATAIIHSDGDNWRVEVHPMNSYFDKSGNEIFVLDGDAVVIIDKATLRVVRFIQGRQL